MLKTLRNIAKEAIKARIIDVKITWVSNYKKFKSNTCNTLIHDVRHLYARV